MPKPLAKNALVQIMLATALPHKNNALTYIAADEVIQGQLVKVPLRKQYHLGMVLGKGETSLPKSRLRPATPLPLYLPSDLQRFIPWLAEWYMEPRGAVLKMAVLSLSATETLLKSSHAASVPSPPPNIPPSQHRLTQQQTRAAKAIIAAMTTTSPPRPFLLDGVTGSGKTEVYFEAVAQALKHNTQVLILLPEIVLSSAFEARFHARFGFMPMLWHSGISQVNRRKVWQAVASATPLVVAGARSALFLPFASLGLIVVDEEHDHSYRQDDGTRYHARDMAVVRAGLANIPLVLASATPSLESEVNADVGRYQRLSLSSRIGTAGMPNIVCVDLRATPPPRGHWLAPPLVEAMQETLRHKQQILLFLNRRGYAPMSLCRACGHRLACRQCSAWLVTHTMQAGGFLHCHHCGARQTYPTTCPNCETSDSLVACGPGVERLDEEVAKLFPTASRCVLSSDGISVSATSATSDSSDAADKKPTTSAFIADLAEGKIDVIIGTQMVAKGHHFPNLTLVGVVDADLGLVGGDLRAGETNWQLLMQVAGRAGREDKKGRVLVQTAAPDAPFIKTLLAGDRAGFIAGEKTAREAADMPPFGRLAAVIVSGRDEGQVTDWANQLRGGWPNYKGIRLLGPAPAPMYRLRGRYRLRFLLQCKKQVNLQGAIREWLGDTPLPGRMSGDMRCKVDIDPVNFL